MSDVAKLTAGQARILAALQQGGNVPARTVAKRAWPDSPGWSRRSHRHSTPAGGAMAVGLPMLAGRMLGQLSKRGLAVGLHRMGSYTSWSLSDEGMVALANYRARELVKRRVVHT